MAENSCLTSALGPDLEPILTGEGSSRRRQPFERAYRVGRVLGKGGFGVVYAGERALDRLPVAIKHISKAKISEWCQVSQAEGRESTALETLPPRDGPSPAFAMTQRHVVHPLPRTLQHMGGREGELEGESENLERLGVLWKGKGEREAF